jgi:hypothetical protein
MDILVVCVYRPTDPEVHGSKLIKGWIGRQTV